VKRAMTILILGFFAAAPIASHAVTTLGDRSCGQWVEARRSEVITNVSTLDSVSSLNYLMGLMTGMALSENDDVLKITDADSVLLWMDQYCQTHPLDMITTGGMRLVMELRGRMHHP
jgi:hypothetical protein